MPTTQVPPLYRRPYRLRKHFGRRRTTAPSIMPLEEDAGHVFSTRTTSTETWPRESTIHMWNRSTLLNSRNVQDERAIYCKKTTTFGPFIIWFLLYTSVSQDHRYLVPLIKVSDHRLLGDVQMLIMNLLAALSPGILWPATTMSYRLAEMGWWQLMSHGVATTQWNLPSGSQVCKEQRVLCPILHLFLLLEWIFLSIFFCLLKDC